jgi:DhnA family fructose-bisphosphate aldolase class Ia
VTSSLFPADGRIVVVAIDHPLYSWPCAGLEDRRGLIERTVAAGADAFIGAYGTLRDLASSFGSARRILKLDLTTVALRSYPLTPYRLAWSIEDAAELGVDAVLTYIQVGGPEELEALCAAARIAALADAAGLRYVCECMPVESPGFPDAYDPLAVAAATRAAAELGAHVVKTTLPRPASELAQSVAFGVPVIVAGGDPAEGSELLAGVRRAMQAGAAGVAFGRNVWGAPDPAARVAELVAAVHGNGGG